MTQLQREEDIGKKDR